MSINEVRERTIELYLLKKVKERGGLCLKFVSPGWAGVPDRIVILNKQLAFVEVKRPSGRLSKLQEFTGKILTEQGMRWRVVYTKKDVEGLINEFYQ